MYEWTQMTQMTQVTRVMSAISKQLFTFAVVCTLLGCQEARRVHRDLPDPERGLPPLGSAGPEGSSIPGGPLEGLEPERAAELDELWGQLGVSCEGEVMWSRLRARGLKLRSAEELSRAWGALLADPSAARDGGDGGDGGSGDESSGDTQDVPTSPECPPHRFAVTRDALSAAHSAGANARQVHVASELNGWAGRVDAGGWALTPSHDGRAWSLERALPIGTHRYKLVIDDQHWIPDPSNPEREGDGFGGENSVITVPCEAESHGGSSTGVGSGSGSGSGSGVGSSANGASGGPLDYETALSFARDALRDLTRAPRPTHYPFSSHAASSRVTQAHVSALLRASETLVSALPSALKRVSPCVSSLSDIDDYTLSFDDRLLGIDATCMSATLSAVGEALSGAPVLSDTLERLTALGIEEAPSIALRALTLTPQLMYRAELGVALELTGDERALVGLPEGATLYELTGDELASALSFALVGGPPDETLRALAASGELRDIEALRAQADRLLRRPEALTRWGRFGVEWLGVEEAISAPKREDQFPTLNDEVRAHLIDEVAVTVASGLLSPSLYSSPSAQAERSAVEGSAVERSAVERSAKITRDLLGQSSHVGSDLEEEPLGEPVGELRWLTPELITYYGLDTSRLTRVSPTDELTGERAALETRGPLSGARFEPYRVEVDDASESAHLARGGALGMGAVMLSYAHSDQTSPILRGLFVRERLLCQAFGPPPPNAGGVPEVDPNATTRERFRQHSDSPACSGCHRLIDELGFGFERFDAVGLTRGYEGSNLINSSGAVSGLENLADPTTVTFTQLNELGAHLAGSERAQQCLMTQLRRFITETTSTRDGVEDPSPLSGVELCHERALRGRLARGELNTRSLIIELVSSPEFRLRRDPPEEEER